MFCTLHGKCKQAFTLMAVAVQTDDFNAVDQTTDAHGGRCLDFSHFLKAVDRYLKTFCY